MTVDMGMSYDDLHTLRIIRPLFAKLERRLATSGQTWNATQLFKVKCYAQDARDYFKSILVQSLTTPLDYRVDTTCYPAINALYASFTKGLGDPFHDICTYPHPGDSPNLNPTAAPPAYTVFSNDNSNRRMGEGDGREERIEPVGALESVEKLALLILFSEHMIAYCDSRWAEVDTSGIDYVSLLNSAMEDDDPNSNDDSANDSLEAVCSKLDGGVGTVDTVIMDIEPLFEDKLKLRDVDPLDRVTGIGAQAQAARQRAGDMEVDNEILDMVGVAHAYETIALHPIAVQ